MIVVIAEPLGVICDCVFLLPYDIRNKVCPPKYLVTKDFEVVSLMIVHGNPDRTITGEQVAKHPQPVSHHAEPKRMLNPVIIVFESRSGVVRRVDEDAPHTPSAILLQGLD